MAKPGHHNQDTVRNNLRTIGLFVLGIGVIFFAIGVISFFASFGSFGPPRYFWCLSLVTWAPWSLCSRGDGPCG